MIMIKAFIMVFFKHQLVTDSKQNDISSKSTFRGAFLFQFNYTLHANFNVYFCFK